MGGGHSVVCAPQAMGQSVHGEGYLLTTGYQGPKVGFTVGHGFQCILPIVSISQPPGVGGTNPSYDNKHSLDEQSVSKEYPEKKVGVTHTDCRQN